MTENANDRFTGLYAYMKIYLNEKGKTVNPEYFRKKKSEEKG